MENKRVRALALFSGGLDSALAIKVVANQGIEVIALNFVSHFFGGKNEKAEAMAKQLGVKLEYVNFSKEHMDIMRDPVYGRGKNMNPCIDCHALMFKVAGELLEKYDAQFIISGEVLGQRPMSQNSQALEKVKALSNISDLIVRPLSAKKLPMSKPEREGLINREKLLDIEGRSRKPQMRLAEELGVKDYPMPGGGCLLTDPGYSKRLKLIEEDGLLYEEYSSIFHILKTGRFFRLGEKKYLFVGRTKEDNDIIVNYKTFGSFFIRGKGVGGPYIIGYGDLNSEEIQFAKDLFSRYCKFKGEQPIEIFFNEQPMKVDVINREEVEEKIKKYQINME
ncbi:MAG: 7-cyano-7-deazaguanine synthase [Fusobacterium perfoetens]|uniref:7-cyano-7-deazaguanine synthase n=1 Tax=Fusobacterium perfoetens TaxID=852 RepID=UPI0023F3DEF1|nr:7-cyano-7-deazaguanine synthase [Fusobacterium perfoetens]MCI6153243.1 7-cyano-7-deazaguanine synthase [Fusobacterium perfoetens]MDY3238344.1 7-cyano-7-deazaguanine synthase [Fusobacterium perfoetens]